MENNAVKTNGLTGDDLYFWEQVFHDLLPVAIKEHGWTSDGKPIASSDDRVALAAIWADCAALERKRRLSQAMPTSECDDE
ncbi:MAG: hypothetical protein GX086_07155 [Alcaligenaceae bacterium]|nr:hypothetical protein [Alcaligenaceae bacterium]